MAGRCRPRRQRHLQPRKGSPRRDPPALPGLATGAAIDQARHADTQATQPQQGIALAQHGGPAERVTEAAAQMPDLALGIEQLALVNLQALHAAFPAPALVGLFDPFPLQLPPLLELAQAT